MADVDNVPVVSSSYLDMSDAEMAAMDAPSFTPTTPVEETEEVVEEVTVVQEEVVEPVTPVVSDDTEDGDTQEGVVETTDKEAIVEEAKEPVIKPEGVDYKAEYDRLLTPFKANGRDIAVDSIDDAIALMQMGANYNKKMAALKPNLKLMKLLENNGLLNEEKLSFLIDLEKKSPEAISKLVKDSGLDPLDLDAEKAGGYKPQTYTVDDREMELDTVLDELQSTPTYNRTLDIVSNKWDGPSKQVIANTPQLLKVINDHVQSGIYDTILKEVEKQRVFGRLNGLSDLEAYRQVGDAIEARGGFKQMVQSSSQKQVPSTPQPVVVTPKPKVEDDKLREKRRAAGSTKSVVGNPVSQDYNPLSLSDEAFGNLVKKAYL